MAFEETGRGTTGRNFLHEGKMQDFYKVGKTLGEGSFAIVREVTCLKDNSKWAAKCIDKKNLSQKDKDGLQVEVDIMGKLDHPCIVHLREVFDSDNTFYMILENCKYLYRKVSSRFLRMTDLLLLYILGQTSHPLTFD